MKIKNIKIQKLLIKKSRNVFNKVLPSQLCPSAFSLYPLPQSQVKDPGTFTQSCSHVFDVLLWHSLKSRSKRNGKKTNKQIKTEDKKKIKT